MKPIPRLCHVCKKATVNKNGLCDIHQGNISEISTSYDHRRGSPGKRGYDHRWREFRNWFLSQNPLCEMCGIIASVVHHIKPIENGGERLDENNCMSVCINCHNAIHHGELRTGWFSAKGRSPYPA